MDKQEKNNSKLVSIISFIILLLGLFITIIVGGYIWRGNITWQMIAVGYSFICLIGYFIWRGGIKKSSLIKTGIELAIGIYILGILGSWILSPDPRQGLGRVAILLGYLLLLYLLIDCFDAGLDRTAAIISLLIISGGALFIAVLETYARYSIWWQNVGDWRIMPPYPYRFTSIIGHSNALMGLANLCAPIAFILFVSYKEVYKKALIAIWIILYFISIPFSSSRGGWLGLIAWIGILFLVFIFESTKINLILTKIKKKIKWLLPVIVLITVAFAYLGINFIYTFSSHPSHGGNPFSGRSIIWRSALEIWNKYPVFGSGPGRFGYEYLDTNQSIPPNFWATHAHSLPVQVLSEFGIFGFLCFTFFLVALLIWLWKQYSIKSGFERKISAGIIAGLGAWLVQMLVDEQTRVIAVMIPIIILLAFLVTGKENQINRWTQIKTNILWLPSAMMLVFFIWNIWNYYPTIIGLDKVNANQKILGSILIDRSIKNDSNFPYYEVVGAYAWAENIENENLSDYSIDKARRYLINVLKKEKNVSLLWANLSVLDWYAGENVTCITNIEKAIKLSPDEPSYYLNLGNYLENIGKQGDAKINYKKTLKLRPEWASHPFWATTNLRQDALFEWDSTFQYKQIGYKKYWQQAYLKILAGDLEAAESLLAYSEWVGEPSLAIKITKAEFQKKKYGMDIAVKEYEDIAAIVTNRKLHNQHNFSLTFNLWLYNREGFSYDLVSGYLQLEKDYGQFEKLEELIDYYLENDLVEESERIGKILQREIYGGSLDVDISQSVSNNLVLVK